MRTGLIVLAIFAVGLSVEGRKFRRDIGILRGTGHTLDSGAYHSHEGYDYAVPSKTQLNPQLDDSFLTAQQSAASESVSQIISENHYNQPHKFSVKTPYYEASSQPENFQPLYYDGLQVEPALFPTAPVAPLHHVPMMVYQESAHVAPNHHAQKTASYNQNGYSNQPQPGSSEKYEESIHVETEIGGQNYNSDGSYQY